MSSMEPLKKVDIRCASAAHRVTFCQRLFQMGKQFQAYSADFSPQGGNFGVKCGGRFKNQEGAVKTVGILLLVLFFLVGTTACGKKADPIPRKAGTAASETVK